MAICMFTMRKPREAIHRHFSLRKQEERRSRESQLRKDILKESRMAGLQQRRGFEIPAEWDGGAEVWWCANDELPLTTEAPTFEQLVSRVLDIAPEIAAENGLAVPGEEIEISVIDERVQSMRVVAAT
jgi:hypothetical protein